MVSEGSLCSSYTPLSMGLLSVVPLPSITSTHTYSHVLHCCIELSFLVLFLSRPCSSATTMI